MLSSGENFGGGRLIAQPGIAQQLPSPCPARIAAARRYDTPVAAELRDFAVVEMVALEFTEDRRAMPAEPARHLIGAQFRMPPAQGLGRSGSDR